MLLSQVQAIWTSIWSSDCCLHGWFCLVPWTISMWSIQRLRDFLLKLQTMLSFREKVISDKGYIGNPFCMTPEDSLNEEHKKFMAKARACHWCIFYIKINCYILQVLVFINWSYLIFHFILRIIKKPYFVILCLKYLQQKIKLQII